MLPAMSIKDPQPARRSVPRPGNGVRLDPIIGRRAAQISPDERGSLGALAARGIHAILASEALEHRHGVPGQVSEILVRRAVQLYQRIEGSMLHLERAVRKDGRQSCLRLELPDHDFPRTASEDESGRRMRGETSIADDKRPLDVVRDGLGDHKEVIRFAVAGGSLRGVDSASNLFEPAGGLKIGWAAIPVPANDPRANQPSEGEGYGVQEIEVGFGGDSDAAEEVGRSTMDASLAHRRHPLHGEAAFLVQALGGFNSCGHAHANVVAGRDGGASRASALRRDEARLDGQFPLCIPGRLFGSRAGLSSREPDLLDQQHVGGRAAHVVHTRIPGIGVDGVDGEKTSIPVSRVTEGDGLVAKPLRTVEAVDLSALSFPPSPVVDGGTSSASRSGGRSSATGKLLCVRRSRDELPDRIHSGRLPLLGRQLISFDLGGYGGGDP